MRPLPSPPTRPAKQYALWLLGQREWSAKELASRLKLKGYLPKDIDACIAFCQQHSFQSDTRYAESRTRLRAKSHGNMRIKQELSNKGVDPDTVSLALADAGDEQLRCTAAAQRFVGKELTQALRSKMWRFLASRGFSGHVIKKALKELALMDANDCNLDEGTEP